MRRGYLLVGDQSTAGGTIVEGIDGASNNGRQISFIGAAVNCPACDSTGHIVASGQRWPGSMMGKQAALDGDLCQCKCTPPPRMIASDMSMGQTFESSSAAASTSSTTVASVAAAATGALAAAGTDAASTGAANSDAGTPLAGEPFTFTPSATAGDATQTAARGVSEDDEAECHAQYMDDMETCNVGRALYKSPAYYQACAARAFQRYQQCRGY